MTTEEKLEIAITTLNTVKTLCTGVDDERLYFLKNYIEMNLKTLKDGTI